MPLHFIIFFSLTLLLSLILLQKLLVDHAHYFSQLLWVLANALWAGGEIFLPERDEPWPLIDG